MKTLAQKKAWTKPELIVLTRSKPEEAVLGACKIAGNTPGPVSATTGCKYDILCMSCDSPVGS